MTGNDREAFAAFLRLTYAFGDPLRSQDPEANKFIESMIDELGGTFLSDREVSLSDSQKSFVDRDGNKPTRRSWNRWAKEHPKFPMPTRTVGESQFFKLSDIIQWAAIEKKLSYKEPRQT